MRSAGLILILVLHLGFSHGLLRVALRQYPSVRSRLRASAQLEEFLKQHQPDMFSRRYVQCFPPAQHFLRLGGRVTERLYNFMDLCTTSSRPSSRAHTHMTDASLASITAPGTCWG